MRCSEGSHVTCHSAYSITTLIHFIKTLCNFRIGSPLAITFTPRNGDTFITYHLTPISHTSSIQLHISESTLMQPTFTPISAFNSSFYIDSSHHLLIFHHWHLFLRLWDVHPTYSPGPACLSATFTFDKAKRISCNFLLNAAQAAGTTKHLYQS